MVVLFFSVCGDAASFASLQVCLPFFRLFLFSVCCFRMGPFLFSVLIRACEYYNVYYPVCPGTDEYIIGTPLFKSAKLHLENGKTITIKADNNQLDNRYIKEMKINGKSNSRNYLTHDQLIKGANIQFQMSPVPNKQRGTTEKDRPYSLSFE